MKPLFFALLLAAVSRSFVHAKPAPGSSDAAGGGGHGERPKPVIPNLSAEELENFRKIAAANPIQQAAVKPPELLLKQ
ncbi:hypothetical protein H4R35_002063 [Dimargaris xerosporica]|nr:hypothetical protein H4R35_002063 [Dimargaris xerosporica]